jgi:flagellar basal body-associated protein FliL
MNKKVIILIVAILIAVLGISIYFGVRFSNISKYTKADTYTLGDKSIPSVKAVVGEKKIKSYKHSKSNIETLILEFEDSDKEQTVEKYMDEIKNSGNYIEANLENSKERELSSAEKGNVISIKSEITDDGFRLTIENGPGSIKIDPIEQ